MSFNTMTSAERTHIAFFGCTNVGKSSLVNAITQQHLSVVSDIKGTTTDPVKKAMEILPIGPVVIIDTAGLDDHSPLGQARIEKAMQVLDKTDIAVLVADASLGLNTDDTALIKCFEQRKIPYVVAFNKADLVAPIIGDKSKEIAVCAKTGEGVDELCALLGKIADENKVEKYLIKDKLKPDDVVVLVMPIDTSAPKGRIILPQQHVLREILDAHATAVCCQVEQLEGVLKTMTPKYVITDSQAFSAVQKIVPEDIILTSFSILMAKYKGNLDFLLKNVAVISQLKNQDVVLIAEACTHHRQCDDLGRVKLPQWIHDYTGKTINFDYTQGGDFPQDLRKYKLIIHCGGCMINEAAMKTRQAKAAEQNVPMINYGMALAYMNGILHRALKIFDNE